MSGSKESGSGAAGGSGSGSSGSAQNKQTVAEFLGLTEEQAANVEGMYAVSPLPWCEHLSAGVQPLPSAGIDVTQTCRDCATHQENWICLTCYEVYCGRYVNQHMLSHSAAAAQQHPPSQAAAHQVTLSFSDLSVWCYTCDSYVNNQVLDAAKRSAYKSKFGEEMPGSA